MATIQGVYIALFGRPADPTGLAYFNTATNGGADLSAIGDLASTAEYQDRFEGMNNIAVINTIYQGLFGRDADAAGLAFFVAGLQSGTYNINNIAIAILDGAQGDDALVVANKLVAANAFTAQVDTATEIASYSGASAAALGVAYLAPVTSDVDTIPTADETTTAVQGVVDAGVAGNTLSFVDGADDVSPTATDADFQSTNNNDTITVSAYTSVSTINGGFGTDTLNVTLGAAAVAPAAGDLVSIEKLFVTSTGLNVALSLADVTGVTEVWNNASGATALTVTDIDAAVAVGVTGAATTTTFAFDDVAGTADTATLVLDTATAGTVTIADIETLAIKTSGVSSLTTLTATSAEEVTITGAGQLTLGGSFAADATVDASDHTGKFIFTTGVVDGLTVIGGASNDTFNVTANAEGVHLTGGAGSDLFNIAAVSNIDDVAEVAADVITITDFSGSADTLSIALNGTETVLTNTQSSDIAAAATIEAALDVAAAASGAGNYAVFQYGGDTYIFQNDAQAAFDSGDGLVKLVGFTGELTDTNFVA